MQTEWTLIRQLLQELPDLGLLCLPKCLKESLCGKGVNQPRVNPLCWKPFSEYFTNNEDLHESPQKVACTVCLDKNNFQGQDHCHFQNSDLCPIGCWY